MRIPDVLDDFDRLTANDRSVASCEAMWRSHGIPGIPWSEAYMVAKHRAREAGADRHDGRTVAFLEGLMVARALDKREARSRWGLQTRLRIAKILAVLTQS